MIVFINKRLEPGCKIPSILHTVQPQQPPTRKRKKLTKENKQFLKSIKLIK